MNKRKIIKQVKEDSSDISQDPNPYLGMSPSYTPQTNKWDAPIIPATKVSPELIQILYQFKGPSYRFQKPTSVNEAAKFYFQKYQELLRDNNKLNDELTQIFQERNFLIEKYNQLKREQTNFEDNIQRKRRYAHQIHRDFPCPMENCNKSYGTQGSLTQHVKLKHQEFYKTGQYEIELQKMLDVMLKQVKKEQKKEQ